MIKNPKESPVCRFEDMNGNPHEVKATTLAHLYGEALATARIIEGIGPSEEPKSLTSYNQFALKLVDHLGIGPKTTISDEVAFLVMLEHQEKITELKKTCIVSDNSAS